jgi:homoserine dehydrogenase
VHEENPQNDDSDEDTARKGKILSRFAFGKAAGAMWQ